MSKFLATMDVRQMHLNEGQGHGCQRVAQGNAGMRECPGIDNQEGGPIGPRDVNAVDQCAFVIVLEKGDIGGVFAGNVG